MGESDKARTIMPNFKASVIASNAIFCPAVECRIPDQAVSAGTTQSLDLNLAYIRLPDITVRSGQRRDACV
jgi:hypothetical protein